MTQVTPHKDKAQCEIKMERDLFMHSLPSLACIVRGKILPQPPPWLSPTKPCSLADKPPPATNLLCQSQEIQPRHPGPDHSLSTALPPVNTPLVTPLPAFILPSASPAAPTLGQAHTCQTVTMMSFPTKTTSLSCPLSR